MNDELLHGPLLAVARVLAMIAQNMALNSSAVGIDDVVTVLEGQVNNRKELKELDDE